MKRVGLGRGLDALFASEEAVRGAMRDVPIDLLQRGRYQPRGLISDDSLEELAASIRSQGVVQPIVIRTIGGGRYEIIAGERRWRAAQLAGLAHIPAVVRECSDEQALAIGIIENIQRQALNPLEEAQALQRLLDEFGLSHEALAESLGRSRAAISNQLRLLRLCPDLHLHVENGALSAGHARALLTLSEERQVRIADRVVREALSVRATERLVQAEGRVKPPQAESDPNIAALSARIGARLGLSVDLRAQGRGGELRIRWDDPEQEAVLFQRLGVSLDDDES
ncbi:ParB/RepB/Spo0J family partition protein [Acidithiobacillus sp.]|uniref:ParB/RepB/Spo0J family partition protein n=1 Tax=Acidithiobacillus sp. TaxID=1872118 RepID=UPI0025B87355|nr:ParB/RepB/Spo0J family partition protein [Acidithiobacillus sp.]MCK9188080.1 ParB/RepB/Spo0J family partition protein [Acidithiobacillus sp.]MCK9360040.1 ParB/RepB/Spo0J family partition protein [Acidithiobacillus sp.]